MNGILKNPVSQIEIGVFTFLNLNSPLLAAWDGCKVKLYSALSAKQSGADVIPCSLLQGDFIGIIG